MLKIAHFVNSETQSQMDLNAHVFSNWFLRFLEGFHLQTSLNYSYTTINRSSQAY